jgi:dihydrofolate reductase
MGTPQPVHSRRHYPSAISIKERAVPRGGRLPMKRIVWAEYVSVDGVVDNPTWTQPFWNDEIAKVQKDQLFRSDSLLLGRVTYEGVAAAWPTITSPDGFADRMNRLPKYVASRTLKDPTWNATVIQGDVPDAVSLLKRENGGDILLYGSGMLAHTLVEHDLIDEIRLMVHPVIVGRGKRLLADGVRAKTLRLVATTPIGSGIMMMRYEPVR